MKKYIAILLSLVLCLGIFAGCSDNSSADKLILGTSADYPPFEFHMLDEDGNDVIVGIDVSVAQKIAADMGVELEIVDISFNNLLNSLYKGEVVLVIAYMEIYPVRQDTADYSDAYYSDLPSMILVKKENVDLYTSLEDFSGVTVGTQTGTTMEDIVTNDMPGAELLSLTSVTDLVNNLVYDKCGALVLNGAVAMQYAESNPDLVVSPIELGQTVTYHVAVAEGDPKELLDSINKSIAEMIEQGLIDTYIAQAETDSENALVG